MPLFGWAWPYTSVIDIVAGVYIPYLYGSIKARVNSIAIHDITGGLTGFIGGVTRLIRFTVIVMTCPSPGGRGLLHL
ncbi:MAG: hypothetical protein ACO2PM_13170 [Pyrobaculum sp.]